MAAFWLNLMPHNPFWLSPTPFLTEKSASRISPLPLGLPG